MDRQWFCCCYCCSQIELNCPAIAGIRYRPATLWLWQNGCWPKIPLQQMACGWRVGADLFISITTQHLCQWPSVSVHDMIPRSNGNGIWIHPIWRRKSTTLSNTHLVDIRGSFRKYSAWLKLSWDASLESVTVALSWSSKEFYQPG